MKADQFGTWTEQVMFRQGFLTSKERQAKGLYGRKCNSCKHIEHGIATKAVRCSLGDFRTTINAACAKYQLKETTP